MVHVPQAVLSLQADTVKLHLVYSVLHVGLSAVRQIYEFYISISYPLHLRVYNKLTNGQTPWLDSSVVENKGQKWKKWQNKGQKWKKRQNKGQKWKKRQNKGQKHSHYKTLQFLLFNKYIWDMLKIAESHFIIQVIFKYKWYFKTWFL